MRAAWIVCPFSSCSVLPALGADAAGSLPELKGQTIDRVHSPLAGTGASSPRHAAVRPRLPSLQPTTGTSAFGAFDGHRQLARLTAAGVGPGSSARCP